MNRKFIFFIFLLILLGLLLRIINLRFNSPFGWDQNNIAMVSAKGILQERHLTLIGPNTGVGNLYLGPLYYYYCAVFFALFNYDPIALATSAIVLFCATLFAGSILIKKLFGILPALIFALVWTTSSFIYSIDIIPWNVNMVPLSSLLVFMGIYSLYTEVPSKNAWILIGMGLFIGISSHLSVIFWLIAVIICILISRKIINRNILYSILLLILGFIPLIIFNFRHQSLIINNFLAFISNNTVRFSFYQFIQRFYTMFFYLLETIGRVILADLPSRVTQITGILFLLILFISCKDKQTRIFRKIFIIYLFIYVLGFSIYSGAVPNYYFMGIIPIAVIGYSLIIVKLSNRSKLFIIPLVLLSLFNLNLIINTVRKGDPKSLGVKQQLIRQIKQEALEKPVQVIYDMDLGWSYGFEYLYYYYKVQKTEGRKDALVFRISFPVSRYKEKSDYIFGDYALIHE